MSLSPSVGITKGPARIVEGVKSDEEFNAEICEKLVGISKDTVERQESLVQRTHDAKDAMKLAVETIRKDMLDWADESKKHLQDIQLWRMAISNEMKSAKTSLADARLVLTGAETETALSNLREFISLCERIEKLKATGTFDVLMGAFLNMYEAHEKV